MRCLALIHAWKERGGAVALVSHDLPEPLHRRVLATGATVVDLPARWPDERDLAATHGAIADLGPGALVCDGYHLDAAYQEALRATGRPLAVVDDYAHLPRYVADLLVNPSPGVPERAYRVDGTCRLMLGPAHALLRPEFLARRPRRREATPPRSILITLGGGALREPATRLVAGLAATGRAGLHVRVVQGPAAEAGLDEALRAAADTRIEVESLRDVRDMAALMEAADLAIAAAGVTAWELAFLGVPMLVTVRAPNQRHNAAGLVAAGAAVSLGSAAELSVAAIAAAVEELAGQPERLPALSEAGRELIDGRGAERVVAALAALTTGVSKGVVS
jgi:spore coat polysaccharide biosynthesis predicted glycosyltransferase SpsG